MTGKEYEKSRIEQVGENLFSFAINREDVKMLVAHLPEEASCKPATVEYELQLLKIISTGWSISFILERTPFRDQLAEAYWKAIHGFAENLSETTELMTGHVIDYFQVARDRLNMYVAALADKPEVAEPAAVIGPEFASLCGDGEDIYTVMAGSRMFIMTIASVKEYLESVSIGVAAQ
jgi:hypothetical protein